MYIFAVGRRYHDLIESADAIAGMNETVTHFERVLASIEAKAEQLLDAKPLPPDHDLALSSSSAHLGGSNKSNNNNIDLSTSSSSSSSSMLHSADILLRAPAEILAALDRGEEVDAATIYLAAHAAGLELNPPLPLPASLPSLSNAKLAEIHKAAATLNLDASVTQRIIRVAEKVFHPYFLLSKFFYLVF